MFGWGRKKPTVPPPLSAEMQSAQNMGKRLAVDAISALSQVMKLRFEPGFERYISILRANDKRRTSILRGGADIGVLAKATRSRDLSRHPDMESGPFHDPGLASGKAQTS